MPPRRAPHPRVALAGDTATPAGAAPVQAGGEWRVVVSPLTDLPKKNRQLVLNVIQAGQIALSSRESEQYGAGLSSASKCLCCVNLPPRVRAQQQFVDFLKRQLEGRLKGEWHVVMGKRMGYAVKYRKKSLGLFYIHAVADSQGNADFLIKSARTPNSGTRSNTTSEQNKQPTQTEDASSSASPESDPNSSSSSSCSLSPSSSAAGSWSCSPPVTSSPSSARSRNASSSAASDCLPCDVCGDSCSISSLLVFQSPGVEILDGVVPLEAPPPSLLQYTKGGEGNGGSTQNPRGESEKDGEEATEVESVATLSESKVNEGESSFFSEAGVIGASTPPFLSRGNARVVYAEPPGRPSTLQSADIVSRCMEAAVGLLHSGAPALGATGAVEANTQSKSEKVTSRGTSRFSSSSTVRLDIQELARWIRRRLSYANSPIWHVIAGTHFVVARHAGLGRAVGGNLPPKDKSGDNGQKEDVSFLLVQHGKRKIFCFQVSTPDRHLQNKPRTKEPLSSAHG
eukprot:GHVT01021041.1.p1 GENE.GHVT01021041.1~~GHVT01021041.1.p1  ORF type:complete len:512 (-),score=70.36 GHVT01021041.1:18-1553(-)